jgi:RHS repeat-associated protein
MPPADQISSTGSIAEAPNDQTYIDDQQNNRVLKVANGEVSLLAGTGVQGYSGDGGPADHAELALPEAVATDAQGDVYIADTVNGRIREVTPDGTINTVVGSGPNRGYCGDWVEGASASQAIISPDQMAVSPSGQLYWVDVCNKIGTLVNGKIETVLNTGSGPGPSYFTFDSAGDLFFSIGDGIEEFSTTGQLTTVAGDPTTNCLCGGGGDGGLATKASFEEIGGLAFDSSGDLFLADEGYNRRIREITPDGIVHAVAGGDSNANGPGCNTAPMPGSASWINGPTDVAVDSHNDLFIGAGGPALLQMTRDGLVSAAICGPMLHHEETGGCNPSEHCSQPGKGEPVNVATGDFYSRDTDLSIPGPGVPLTVSRAYDAFAAASGEVPGPLGYGWALSYGMSLDQDPYTGDVSVTQEDGSQVVFVPNGSGGFASPTRVLATLIQNADGSWTFTRKAREKFSFNPAGQLTQVQDLNGYSTTLSYDAQGRLASVTDPVGRSVSFSYDSSNRITQISDPAGRTVSYGYDDAGNLSTVTDLDGGMTTYGYDSNHRLTSITDPRGHTVLTNSYDSDGRVAWQTDGLARKTTFSYALDETTTTSPAGNETEDIFNGGALAEEIRGVGTPQQATWQYQYDTTTYGVSAITDPNGHTTTNTYNSAGDLLSTQDAVGHQTNYTYDSLNDKTSVSPPTGATTNLSYDASGNLLSVSTSICCSGQTQTTTYTHGDTSHPGYVTKITDPDGNATTLTYDQYGDLASSTDAAGDQTTYTYDTVGRRISMVSPDGNATGGNPSAYTTTYTYDPAGHLLTQTDPLGHKTTNTYDADQNLASTTDPDGNTTRYTYDNANELTGVTRADGTTLTKTYDADGNLASQTDGAGHTTTYTYDPLDRLASTTDPLNRTTTYGYDGAGNRTSVTDAKGRTTIYGYDAANHLTSINYSDGQTPDVTYGYDNDGERVSMADGTGTTSYNYDALHRLTSTTDGAGHTVSYTYDLANNETAITYPNGKTITRTFGQANRLATVKDWLGNTTSFGYDANSNPTSITFPSGTGNIDSFGYNQADQLTSVSMTQGQSTLATLAYTRDPIGQVTAETQTGLPGPTNTSYTYTKLNQLATAGTSNYSYDNAGNLTQLDGNTGYTYDQADELTSSPSATYSYDQLGERTSSTPIGSSPTTYSYDQAGRLIAYTPPSGPATTFAYNGDGLRASKTTGSTTANFTWDTTAPLALILDDGRDSYIYGPDDIPIEQITSAGVPGYLHHDQLGSTRLITDQTGSTTGSFTYNTYGATLASTGSATTSLGYAAQYADQESGLVYLRARYYDPATGQFLTPDPLETESRQAYEYATDNPVNARDPSGLLSIDQLLDSLNPVTYFESEITAYENGCGYLNAVTHGLEGTLVAAGDVSALRALAGLNAIIRGAAGLGSADLAGMMAKSASTAAPATFGEILNQLAEMSLHKYLFIASSYGAYVVGGGAVLGLVYNGIDWVVNRVIR